MPTKFDIDPDFVRKLAKLLEETGLSEIEFAEGDKKIRCAVNRGTVVHTQNLTAGTPAPQAETPASEAKVKGTVVPSPMVGTAYLAASPGATPFVKVGDKVSKGDTLVIIEAMKVMNPIKAPVGGTITEILVEDTKPVEFGETLLVIA